MDKIGEKAKLASLHLSNVNIDKRNSVLKQFSQYLKKYAINFKFKQKRYS
tara:strand:+ start:398 stop:547 length:150 start_codon:yes stop_codon:yes gene_type:complete